MRRTISSLIAFGAVVAMAAALSAACSSARALAPPGQSTPLVPAAAVSLPRHSAILTSTKLAAEYYRTTYAHTTAKPTNGWSWATYAQGVQALYRQAGDFHYLSDGLAWGRSNAWGIYTGAAEFDPDTIKAGLTYYDLHAIDTSASLAAMDSTMAKDLARQPLPRYDWIDALFMGLPNWARWATRTGNSGYLTKLDALYVWIRDQGGTSSRCAGMTVSAAGLFDAAQGLWYRDCRFVGTKDLSGKPIFWARGNGWVIGAMAQVLQTLPATNSRRMKYATMLKTMASHLIALQGSDGMWRASLVDPAGYPQPETSGSALITYGLAYGIKSGILDAATYLPVVARAWNGLTTISLQPGGFVTDCQPAGISPAGPYTAKAPRTAPTPTSAGTVNADSPPYCVGVLLLAGSQVAQLKASPSAGRGVRLYSGQQVGNEARRVDDGDVTTRWSASPFPQGVLIDLGANKSISNAMVVPYLDRAYRYRIDTSTDLAHWTLVVNQAANTKPGSRLDDFAPGPVTARYVRLTVTGVYGVSTTWESIQEFAVY